MPHAATYSVPVIRTNFGSHRRVAEVYGYEPATKTALVKFVDGSIDRVECSELESLESDLNTYADLDRALRDAAHEIAE